MVQGWREPRGVSVAGHQCFRNWSPWDLTLSSEFQITALLSLSKRSPILMKDHWPESLTMGFFLSSCRLPDLLRISCSLWFISDFQPEAFHATLPVSSIYRHKELKMLADFIVDLHLLQTDQLKLRNVHHPLSHYHLCHSVSPCLQPITDNPCVSFPFSKT